jgi:hypothetical protein
MPTHAKIPVALWIAIISLLGTIITALLNPNLIRIIVPEDTPTPTTTLVPATATLTETPIVFIPTTPASFSTQPPPATTDDLIGDCLAVDIWISVPAETGAGGKCLDQVRWGIAPYRNVLTFYQQAFREQGLFGASRSIPRNANIRLTVTVDQLEAGEIWIGLTSAPDPLIESWMLVIQKGGYLDVREIKNGRVTLLLNNHKLPFEDDTYQIELTLVGSQIDLIVNKNRVSPSGSINFGERRIFLGYRAVLSDVSTYVSAQVKDLTIEER